MPHKDEGHKSRSTMNGRQACVFVCVLLVGLGYASAAPQGEFKRARDITDCTTCIEHGYGWCPRRRRCGYFRNKQCSGMSTDYANEVLTQELTYENYEKALYDPRRTSFVFFHSELDKGAELFVRAVQHVVVLYMPCPTEWWSRSRQWPKQSSCLPKRMAGCGSVRCSSP